VCTWIMVMPLFIARNRMEHGQSAGHGDWCGKASTVHLPRRDGEQKRQPTRSKERGN
jgi:hypothetical protein